MGGEQSKGKPQLSYEDFQSKYDIHHKSTNDVQVLLEKGTTDQFLGIREFNFSDETPFFELIKKFEPKKQLSHQNVIQLIHVLQHKESQFCSTFFRVYLVFEHVENTLEQEIRNRISLNCRFSEEEIWNILTQCILGLNYLYQKGLAHSNINSSNIYITQEGIVKVAEPSLLGQSSLYSRVFTSSASAFPGDYFAPELLAAMYEQQLNPPVNQQKCDVFTLGMVTIEAALLNSLDAAYNYNACTVDQGVLTERLSQIREIYGPNLSNFLASMTAVNVDERKDLNDFDNILTGQQLVPENIEKSEEIVKRAPAQPVHKLNKGLESSVTQNVQEIQSGQQSAPVLFRDAEDEGSTINFIPLDKTSKMVVPDENFGNAIGGGSQTIQDSQIGTTAAQFLTSNIQDQSNSKIPKEYYHSNQSHSVSYQASQRAPGSYQTPLYEEMVTKLPQNANGYYSSLGKSTATHGNQQHSQQYAGVLSAYEEQSKSGVYVSTKDQEIQRSILEQQFNAQPANAQSQYRSQLMTNPAYVPQAGNTNYGLLSTTQAANQNSSSYQFGLNQPNQAKADSDAQANLQTNTYQQEEQVKRSTAAATQNFQPSASIQNYSSSNASNFLATNKLNGSEALPSSTFSKSEEIEAILQKFRNQSGAQNNSVTNHSTTEAHRQAEYLQNQQNNSQRIQELTQNLGNFGISNQSQKQ